MPSLAAGTDVYRPSEGTRAASSSLFRQPQAEAEDNLNTGNSSPASNQGAADTDGPNGPSRPNGDQEQSSPPPPPSSPLLPTILDAPTSRESPASLASMSYPSATGTTQASQSNAPVTIKNNGLQQVLEWGGAEEMGNPASAR